MHRLLTYLEWATESARMLRPQISDRDLDQLVFTDRYRVLLGSCGTLAGTAQQRLVNGLVQLEVAERIEAFEAAVAALDTRIGGWSQREVFVVADSSFYIQNEVKLADVDLHEVLDVPRWQFVRLLFPIVVVDELDDLKDASKQRARWRAAHTLGLLDGVLNGGTHGVLHEGSASASARTGRRPIASDSEPAMSNVPTTPTPFRTVRLAAGSTWRSSSIPPATCAWTAPMSRSSTGRWPSRAWPGATFGC
ncbi:hypothetical protein [Actinoallomurus rhizosphaericola]|uniref:hypothetical protein n=1 Tax=Actinoallomurus rhizosphaericola TaxID=2952536 RepID=UPI002093FB56|nr:hypothetical protein [Actinoallomurus rhizosphaericola]MCO5996666.1 hypothetical protein [Actinoallomurus rhizosphaericola]